MELLDALKERHSVRKFTGKKLEPETAAAIEKLVYDINRESGLRIRFIRNDKKAFNGLLAKSFSNANDYLAMAGIKEDDLDEKVGYYGEKIVLELQRMGLRTCFVGGTYSKNKDVLDLAKGERLVLVIALGYGAEDGKEHKNRKISDLANLTDDSPAWFRRGLGGAMLAPTAMNQQKWHLELEGDGVIATPGKGSFTDVDLGIVKYNFEVASGKDHSIWL